MKNKNVIRLKLLKKKDHAEKEKKAQEALENVLKMLSVEDEPSVEEVGTKRKENL